jgi:hypothetical protein
VTGSAAAREQGPRGPLDDLREEAPRVLARVQERGLQARAVGGLAVWLRCPSARQPPLAREYKDLDLVAALSDAPELVLTLGELGYRADEEFNALHGHQRLYFWDAAHGRQLDVFVDEMRMCHTLDLRGRVAVERDTVPLADLLLAKLQVVEINEKDLQDATALLADHEVPAERVVEVLAGDWGWWRTATETLDKVAAYAGARVQAVAERVATLRAAIDAAPKSRRWKLRAKVGERMRWYELPEEIEG